MRRRYARLAAGASGVLAVAVLAGVASLPPSGPPSALSPGGSWAAEAVALRADGVRVNRRLSLAVTSPSSVATDQVFAIRGVAKVTRKVRTRPTRIAVRRGGRWRTLSSDWTNRRGRFGVRTSASRAGTKVFKVTLRRHRGLPAASRTVEVEVVAPPGPATGEAPAEPSGSTPLGSPTDWSYIAGDAGRWDPCAVIEWSYDDSNGGYAGALADAQQAFDRIADRTGLTFGFVGTVDATPFVDPAPTTSDFHLGWSAEAEYAGLAGGVVGMGGPRGYQMTDDPVFYHWRRGALVLDREHTLRQGFDVSGTPTWGQVMVHEILHALGLGHAAGAEQLMYGRVSSVNHLFGAGDLTGMTKIGAEQGCL